MVNRKLRNKFLNLLLLNIWLKCASMTRDGRYGSGDCHKHEDVTEWWMSTLLDLREGLWILPCNSEHAAEQTIILSWLETP